MTAEVFAVDVKSATTFSLDKKKCRNAKVGAAGVLVLQNIQATDSVEDVLQVLSDVVWGEGLVGAAQIGKAKSVQN
jgi:hypothetical protein